MKWAIRQKANLYRGENLTSDQIDLLNMMNLVTNINQYVWNIRLEKLKELKRIYGHLNVPNNAICQIYPKLGNWVENNKHKLSKKEISDLDGVKSKNRFLSNSKRQKIGEACRKNSACGSNDSCGC